MSNYAERETKIKLSVEDAFDKACAIFDLLDWYYESNTKDLVVAHTPFSIFGSGEIVTVSLKKKGYMEIASECRNAWQLGDLGKNESNIDKFLEIFRKAKMPLEESEYAYEKKRSFLSRFLNAK